MRWIKANQLETWARTVPSRIQLPGIVSDLIRASASDIATMRFPSGDKGQVRGFDGHLVSSTSAINVPAGRSIWEMGVDSDYRAKAGREFKKRTAEVPAAEQKEITYVFVSPWTWDSSDKKGKIEDWIAARKAESEWKDVVYLDGSALETWLEQRPAVSAWHARNTLQIRPQEGVRSTDEFWKDFSGRYGPPMTEQVVLCERDLAAQQLLKDLLQPGNMVSIVADSPDEVVAFAIAAIRSAAPELRLFFEARTLVVDSTAAGRQLFGTKDLVLLLRNDAARSPGQFLEMGSALVPLGRQQRGGAFTTLTRPSGHAMGMAMRSMGFEDNLALTLARGSGRSLTALARLRPGGDYEIPHWAQKGSSLLPAILAGAWDTSNANDREVITRIAGGIDCAKVEGEVRHFLKDPDPPLDLEGTVYKVRAPMDAFIRIGPLIGADDADRLCQAMSMVFSRAEPEVRPDDIVGVAKAAGDGHSDWLRDGLATTLLLFAVWSKQAEVNIGRETGQEFADGLLRDLPGLNTDPRILTSLKNELPLLAEAAPDPLLQALEHLLEGRSDLVRRIFDEHEGIPFPSYSHTGVLWALETIAWDPAYFRRAVLTLARLAEIAPEIRLVNTPANSLAEIFLLWNPSTNAQPALRMAVLKEIVTAHPEVGWRLVVQLLPKSLASSTATQKPKLREAGASERPPMTYRELWEQQAAIAAFAIELAGDDEARWIELIPSIHSFAPLERGAGLAALDRLLSGADPDVRKRLWARVRDEAARHQRFKGAKWALAPDQLSPFLDIVSRYAPDDPVIAVAALFDEWSLDQTGSKLVEAQETRATAVRRLYDDFGPPAVLRLAAEARVPYLVMETVGAGGVGQDELRTILSESFELDPGSDVTRNLAGLYRRVAGETRAEEWLRSVAVPGDPVSTADFLRTWPEQPGTWYAVRRFGKAVADAYWTRRSPSYLQGSRRTLLRSLLMQMRYGSAIQAIQSSLNRMAEVPTRLLFMMLDGAVPQLNAGAATADTMTTYYIEKAFEALDSRADASDGDVARREFAFFPLLEHGNRSLRIHALMASSPEFYHQILCDVFRSETESEAAVELDESRKRRALSSYHLLSSFTSVPGVTGAGIDEGFLTSWIDAVRRLGEQSGRGAVTYNFIGRMLAHSPPDPDGGWPHRAVRNQIERLASSELESGIRIARFNMRGVHGREMFEGGEQERALAAKNAESAAIAAAWPRTSALLAATAKEWESDAQREDVEAAQRKLRS
jgi:hypothetical protein